MIRLVLALAALALLLTACFRPAPPEEPNGQEPVLDRLSHQDKDACDGASTITIGSTFTLFDIMYVNVVLEPGASIDGAGEDAYIACSVTHIVDDTSAELFFPVGDDAGYRPVELQVQQDSAERTAYTAEVMPGAAAAVSDDLQNPLKRVSNVRYWSVFKEADGAELVEASVTLHYGSDDGVTQPSTLSIAQYNDDWGAWRRVKADARNNTITTRDPVTLLTPDNDFTLGDVSSGRGRAGNPLGH